MVVGVATVGVITRRSGLATLPVTRLSAASTALSTAVSVTAPVLVVIPVAKVSVAAALSVKSPTTALAPTVSVTAAVGALDSVGVLGVTSSTQSAKMVSLDLAACFTTSTNPPLVTMAWVTLTFRVIELLWTLFAIFAHPLTEEPVVCGTLVQGQT